MEHLPVSYYRIGQPIQVDEIDTERSVVLELNRHYIAYQFGQERDGLYYSRSVSPEFVKPILRPLSQIRISHVIELFRRADPESEWTDEEITYRMSFHPDLIGIYAEHPQQLLWLMSLNYDVEGLINKGLAVPDED